tara:strand:- start:197 stop:373 length:177 start_codon:yes stop_codon:yes gene_type:complete
LPNNSRISIALKKEKAGILLTWDNDADVRTSYDDFILIMPCRRLYNEQKAVRLGRKVD